MVFWRRTREEERAQDEVDETEESEPTPSPEPCGEATGLYRLAMSALDENLEAKKMAREALRRVATIAEGSPKVALANKK